MAWYTIGDFSFDYSSVSIDCHAASTAFMHHRIANPLEKFFIELRRAEKRGKLMGNYFYAWLGIAFCKMEMEIDMEIFFSIAGRTPTHERYFTLGNRVMSMMRVVDRCMRD